MEVSLERQNRLLPTGLLGGALVGVAQFAHGGGFALHGEESKGATVLSMARGRGALTMYDTAGQVSSRFP